MSSFRVLSINRYLSVFFFFFSPPYSRIFYRVNSFADTFIFRFDGSPFIDKYSIPEAANWFSVRHPRDFFFFFKRTREKYRKSWRQQKLEKGCDTFAISIDPLLEIISSLLYFTRMDRKKNHMYESDIFLFEIYIVLRAVLTRTRRNFLTSNIISNFINENMDYNLEFFSCYAILLHKLNIWEFALNLLHRCFN